jgi:predicted nucleic acid-binding protein
MIVLDASVMLGFLLPDEEHAIIAESFARVRQSGAVVPVHWYSEVANSMMYAVKRGRISAEYRDEAAELIGAFDIDYDPVSMTACFSETTQLALRHGLTVYDAAYLELALRANLPLASLDAALVRAARAEGVTLIGQPA